MQMLDTEAVTGYRRNGFLFPISGIGAAAARDYRAALEAFEGQTGQSISLLDERFKPHVRFPWANRLVREPTILDAIERVIGPDILVWTATFFVKEPQSDAVTLWHQDWTFFGLRPHEHVTAWIALSEASVEAGCMRFVPGKDAARPMRHRPKADPNSMNGGGQCVTEPFDPAGATHAALATGEFSLHNTLCIHSSAANNSEDRFGNFVLERPPTGNDAADAAYHAEIYRTYRAAYNEQVRWHEEGRTP